MIATWVGNYCLGCSERTLPLPLGDAIDTLPPYTSCVLTALAKVPFGSHITYQELALRTGNPRAARAVGNACRRNPIPLVIPCHRVLAAGSYLGGFSQGLEVKRRLLAFEGIAYLR